ncbi:tetratricopeptide repeat protein [Clostridium saccharoperbutylacetonicum]|uniref:tetratricopeptide repeat protein n=1 Tax=Clostridium saccharoperbutylacetonicum TaxID=36745 RepID=UPI0039ECEC77
MFNNEILSPNQKLKSYRNIIGATQDDIAGEACSKYLISQIENNKKHLSNKIAISLAKNINKVIDMKSINISHISVNQLTENEDSQANRLFSNNVVTPLQNIKEIDELEEKLNFGESLIKKYNIQDNFKIEMYKLAATIYYFKEKVNYSDRMCRCGLKICFTLKDIIGEIHFYISKARNNVYRKEYDFALDELDFALKLNRDVNDSELFQRIYFNRAMIYQQIGETDKAIKYFKKIMENYKMEEKRQIDIKMMIANCLVDDNKLSDAEKLYIELLEQTAQLEDHTLLSMTYRNLSEVYLKQSRNKDSVVAIDKSLEYNPCDRSLARYLYFASEVYRSTNKDYEKFLLRALNVSEMNDSDDSDLIKKIINDLVEIYMEREDEENIKLLLEKEKKLNVNYRQVYTKLIKYYKNRNEEKMVLCIERLIEIVE